MWQNGRIRGESGFTLIELLIVIVLLGISTTMFATLFGTVLSQNSVVQSQNIIQTDARAALNQIVADIRSANSANATFPVISANGNSISFYSPDRLNGNGMRRVKYWMNGTSLTRQVTMSTGYNTATSKWTGLDSDTGPIQEVISPVKTPAVGDATKGGWAAGQIFKYCVKAPPDMNVDPTNSTSAELITWACEQTTVVAKIKTVVIRAVVSAPPDKAKYNYGAVATLRWNVS
jgi:prepilin-type N-terminal cleavage/methylation domain-containing protein